MSPEARERSFDELARGLANGSISRRKALRLMGAALVGGTLGSLGFGRIAAAAPPGCRHDGKQCKRDKQCCSGNCSTHGRCVGAPGAGRGECALCQCGRRHPPRNQCGQDIVRSKCVELQQGESSVRVCQQVCSQMGLDLCNNILTRCPNGCPGPA